MPSSKFLLVHPLQAFDENNALKDSEQIDKLAGLSADFCVFAEITEQPKCAHAQNKKEVENFSWETI